MYKYCRPHTLRKLSLRKTTSVTRPQASPLRPLFHSPIASQSLSYYRISLSLQTTFNATGDNQNKKTSTYVQSQNRHRHLRWTPSASAPHQTRLLFRSFHRHHPGFWCPANGWSTVLQNPPGLTAFVAVPPRYSPAAVLSTPPVSQYSWLCVARWRRLLSIYKRKENK